MRSRSKMWAAVLTGAAATALTVPAVGSAAPQLVIEQVDANGQKVPLTPGPQPTNSMNIRVGVTTAKISEYYQFDVIAPNGQSILKEANKRCQSFTNMPDRIPYSGNGEYKVHLTAFSGRECAGTSSTTTTSFNVQASTTLDPKISGSVVLARKPGTNTPNEFFFTASVLPGSPATRVRWGRNASLGPDGNISSTAEEGKVYNNPPAPLKPAPVTFTEPGRYTVISAAESQDTVENGILTPWSAPIFLRVKVPFDLIGVSWVDREGPSLKLRWQVKESAAARGQKIKIKIKKGKGKWRSYGSAKVRKGYFYKRFRAGAGSYRYRVSTKGNKLLAGGWATGKFSIVKRYRFR